jgi:hypothetical protein
MGGVYAVGLMPYNIGRHGMEAMPPDRQGRRAGLCFAFGENCHVFAFAKPGFFVPSFAGDLLIADYGGTKRAALMI